MKPNKKDTLLRMLKRRWVTPLDALQGAGVLSLAQRVSEWRADGMVIIDRWVETQGGSRVKAYRIVAKRTTAVYD